MTTDKPDHPPDAALWEGFIAQATRRLHGQMAHDIRGLLNSISLNATLLGRGVRGELEHLEDPQERQVAWVDAVATDVAQLDRLLAPWSRFLTAEISAPSDRDVRMLLGDLDTLLSALARRHGVALEVVYPEADGDAAPLSVQDPESVLWRLLVSLVTASINASGPSEQGPGKLRLFVEAVDAQVVFRVTMPQPVDPGTSAARALTELLSMARDVPGALGQSLMTWKGDEAVESWTLQWPEKADKEESTPHE